MNSLSQNRKYCNIKYTTQHFHRTSTGYLRFSQYIRYYLEIASSNRLPVPDNPG